MTDDERNHEALFRHAILGDLLSRNLRRGQLRPALKQLAQQTYQDHHGRSRRVAYKTLEEWYYKNRNGGCSTSITFSGRRQLEFPLVVNRRRACGKC